MSDLNRFRGLKALIVDDNANARLILGKLLTAWGFEVHEASGGEEALAAMAKAEAPFALVVLDYQMPGMDGVQLARKIRDERRWRTSAVILLSSWGNLDRELEAELGLLACLTKPVRQRRLRRVLRHVLHTSGPETVEIAVDDLPTARRPRRECFRLLLAEDNRTNQMLARRLLEKAGYAVDLVKNGQLAVEAVAAFRYDLVLMDIQMPIMDGFEATRKIRAGEILKEADPVPVVALTAHALKGYREKCLSQGLNDYVTKPIKRDELLGVLDRWIDRQPVVLIVDDQEENRRLLEILLRKGLGNLHLECAAHGEEALEMFQRRRFSLILMDMSMPRMSGFEATAAIRQLKYGDEVPILALTGFDSREEMGKCMEAGCDAHLAKPYEPRALQRLASRFLSEGRSAGDADLLEARAG